MRRRDRLLSCRLRVLAYSITLTTRLEGGLEEAGNSNRLLECRGLQGRRAKVRAYEFSQANKLVSLY